MYSPNKTLTELDLEVLATLRSAYSISLEQHKEALEELGISGQQWEDLMGSTGSTGTGTNECVICLSKPSTFSILPCGHLCLCQDCCGQVAMGKVCPKCRGNIEFIQKIFM